MNLVLDIGNTQFKLSTFENNKVIFHEYLNELDSLQLNNLVKANAITKAIYSDTRGVDKVWLEGLFPNEVQLIELTHQTTLPIKINYDTPHTLGKDRIAAAVGANWLFPNTPILVLDIGTAITIDFVSPNNTFEGGIISPGQELRFKALHHFTGKLPLTQPSEIQGLAGKSTLSAIQLGIINGIVFEINGYISRYKKQYSDLKILITGGDAYLFDRKINYPIFAESFLVPIGLNTILNYNE